MHPIERLRYIARADDEPASVIASEAAWSLGELGAGDPAAVLTASRRLVERHPACGPLWWACAKLLVADDPLAEAHRVVAEFSSDVVANRLSDALRSNFTASDVLCSTAPADLLSQALDRRGSYRVRLIGRYFWLRHGLRQIGARADDATGYEAEEMDEALSGAGVLLVEPRLASPAGLLVDLGTGAIAERAAASEIPVWVLLATGHVLPPDLATFALGRAGDGFELIEPDVLSRAVDETGLGDLQPALRRAGCPPAPELARRDHR